MKKTILIILALLVLLILIPGFIPDEEYSAESQRWIELATTVESIPKEENRFNALTGFNVAASKNMIEEGARLIEQVNNSYGVLYEGVEPYRDLDTYMDEPPLNTSLGLQNSNNDFLETDPVAWLEEHAEFFEELKEENRVLLERYRTITTMDKYSYTMKLDVFSPFLHYTNIIAVHNLYLLDIVNEYQKGNQQQAINDLLANIEFTRLSLKQSALLIEKMVSLKLLNNSLDTFSYLLDKKNNKALLAMPINNLSQEERSLENSFQSEFVFMSNSLDPWVFMVNKSFIDKLEYLVVQFYLKRKRIENLAQKYQWQHMLDQQDKPLGKREPTNFPEPGLLEKYTDPIGHLILSMSSANLLVYPAKVESADAKITLINAKQNIYAQSLQGKQVQEFISTISTENLKGYRGATITWDAQERVLSYIVPDYNGDDIPRVPLH